MAFLFVFLLIFTVFITLFFTKQMASGLEEMAKWVSSFLKLDFSACVDLDLMVNDHTLMRNDGSLVSVFEFHGIMQVPGNEEFVMMVTQISDFISAQMNKNGHSLQVVYRQDAGASAFEISRAIAKARATAKRINLDMEDVLRADEEILVKNVVNESVWIVVTTNISASNDLNQVEEERNERFEKAKKMRLPNLGFAQNPVKIIESLIAKHDSFCKQVEKIFSKPGQTIATKLSSHEIISSMRKEIQPLSTGIDYSPCLPGDHPPATASGFGVRPWEDIYYPPIWSQLCNTNIEEYRKNGMETVFVDGVWHGTVAIDLPPQDPRRFEELMQGLRDIPFRISYRLDPGGLASYKFNHTLVQFLSFNPKSDNRSIKDAIERIMLREKGNDVTKSDPALGVTISITTWHVSEKTMISNLQSISRAVQSWGGCDVLFGSGDPVELFVSGVHGVSKKSPARSMLMNGSDIATMLPITRPAASWREGSVIFTTLDGKMMPFQPGSSIQKAWVYLVFATMGSGKSVLLNTIELGMCLSPGISKLPYMTIIDIGESVSGTISMIESSLPAGRKSETGYFRVKMSAEFAYNVFDLQLGFRIPHARDRDFLKNFMSILATPAGQSKVPPMMSELMGAVIDEAYRQKGENGNPSRYQQGVNNHIDSVLDEIGMSVDSDTSWYEVTDYLFKFNRVEDAILAQRYAVPNLQHIPNVLRSGAIRDVFGRTKDGLDLIEMASIMINSAIRDYPVLSMPTQWDIGMCRVVGIDLNDVKGHGESGAKQTALMYAFAQQSAARNYYLNDDALTNCPPEYLAYHKKRVEEIQSETKAIIYDEFHNTKGIEGIRKIVSTDIREGRKWKIMTVLSSQLLDDFDDDAVQNMTGTFILGANGNEGIINKCKSTFGLSDSAVNALRRDVTEAGVGLAIFNTKAGVSTMVFRNHLSSIKSWGFSSTAEDKILRKILYNEMPASIARQLLAKRFPSSTMFKEYVEQQQNSLHKKDGIDESIIRVVAQEIIAEYRKISGKGGVVGRRD